jgi:hypothetical protein
LHRVPPHVYLNTSADDATVWRNGQYGGGGMRRAAEISARGQQSHCAVSH